MGYKLTGQWVILCEGEADAKFLRKLRDSRDTLPKDIDIIAVDGKDRFVKGLDGIRADARAIRMIKGVLIVADSADSPDRVFADIQTQIRASGGYGVPTHLLEKAKSDDNLPPLMVISLPDEATPGGLESLFLRDLNARFPWVTGCVNEFLACGEGKAASFSAEKKDKAKFAATVAATHEQDPSRAASWAFRDPAVIEIGAACFDGVVERLRRFCTASA